MMRFLSLFAGIGGFDLGLERAGWECAGQVEIEPFCQKVLAKHWPNVWRHDDVRTLTAETISEQCGRLDAIVGGFPCQDISVAGQGAGINGKRSGLYWEIHRFAKAIRPRCLVLENVPALRTRGIDDVLLSLARIGYVGWPFVVGAWAVQAPHKRNRCWIVAFSAESGFKASQGIFNSIPSSSPVGKWQGERMELGRGNSGRVRRLPDAQLLRVDDGFPAGLDIDRIGALGNAIVPQCAEVIGRAIMQILDRFAE